MKRLRRAVCAVVVTWAAGLLVSVPVAAAAPATAAAEPLRIGFIDPLSGPYAAIGAIALDHVRFAVDDINARGGIALGGGRRARLELLLFDSKLSAQESQSALQSALDQGVRAMITGVSGSAVTAALVEAANRHNERQPERPVLILNHSSTDPDLTGRRCSFWHFAFEANTAMKMKALANFVRRQPEVKRLYLLNQDYAHGRQWAGHARELLPLARPDLQFVGQEFHPIARVKDFAPYVSKITSAGADTVVTGNWGPDLTLLLRAAADAGADLRYLNHTNAGVPGVVTAMALARRGRLTSLAEWHPGQPDAPRAAAVAREFEQRMGRPWLAPRIDLAPRMLAAAAAKAGSLEPRAMALAMEDMVFDSVVGPVRMRAQDHQLLLPQVVNTVAPVDGKTVKVGWEGTAWGFRTDAVYTGNELAQGSECRMNRP